MQNILATYSQGTFPAPKANHPFKDIQDPLLNYWSKCSNTADRLELAFLNHGSTEDIFVQN